MAALRTIIVPGTSFTSRLNAGCHYSCGSEVIRLYSIPGGFPPRPIGGLDAKFARESVVLLIRNKRGHCIVSPLMAGAGSKGGRKMLTEFDQNTIANMTAALEYVCKQIPLEGDAHAVRKQVADAIIESANGGRRSLIDFQNAGLGRWKISRYPQSRTRSPGYFSGGATGPRRPVARPSPAPSASGFSAPQISGIMGYDNPHPPPL
jgi:hypothetical protein